MTKYVQKPTRWWQDARAERSRRVHFWIHRFASPQSYREKRRTADLRRDWPADSRRGASSCRVTIRCVGNLRFTTRGASIAASSYERAQDLLSNPIECCAARVLTTAWMPRASAFPSQGETERRRVLPPRTMTTTPDSTFGVCLSSPEQRRQNELQGLARMCLLETSDRRDG